MKAFSVTSMLLLGSMSTVFAAPTNDTDYPEVIPGPGLPSLASLGLTSADLYEKKPALLSRSPNLSARNLQECYPTSAQTTDAIACYNYLLNLGNTNCVVQKVSTFCFAKTAQIKGTNELPTPSGTTSSPCSEVAAAALEVIDSCRASGTTTVGGFALVDSNDNLAVSIEGRN